MLICASLRSNKSDLLHNKYIELINNGIPPAQILALCLNAHKKQKFLNFIQNNLKKSTFGKFNVQTFFGLCYNALSDNWVCVENSLNFGESALFPNLCGLELSRMLLSKSISKGTFQDYFSKTNLLHQLFKRIQLSVLNSLSDSDLEFKSKLLNESFFIDAKNTYENFKYLSLKYRSFDYLRQLSILPFIVKNTDYFKKIKYLFVDDADELTFAEFDFIKSLLPGLDNYFIAFDNNGASRCGYLSAYKTAVFQFPKWDTPLYLKVCDTPSQNADKLFKNILSGKKTLISNMYTLSFIRRLDMLDCAFSKINELLKNGADISDILIVTPVIDDMLKSFCSDFNSQFISGSEKPKETRFLRNIITFLKLNNPDWNLNIDASDLKAFFFDCLQIPQKFSQNLVSKCIQNRSFVDFSFDYVLYQKNYDKLKLFVQNCTKLSLSSQILSFFNYFSDNKISKKDLKKFNFFLKEIRSFETAFPNTDSITQKNIILQFENGIISENPSAPDEIEQNSVIISTPQKVIDFEIRKKYHFWLDISNDLWTMRDVGVLYNAWVFNAEWKNKSFTFDDNIRLSNEKNARVLRKLLLCCEEKIFVFSSQYDSSGHENFGIMPSYFICDDNKSDTPKTKWSIVPRKDQLPVVNYNGGFAAVNAVPGAGKTTVLTALLIQLIKKGFSPSNIFVLTYMESAASNIREKIKLAIPNQNELPYISTIHGLAFRILKENNNYAKLNLPDNIDVVDDNTRQKIIRECISELALEHDDYDDYEKGISVLKLSPDNVKPLKSLKNSKSFYKLFPLYEKKLKKEGLIDYDDMLRYAVKLISDFPGIGEYYADLCSFIIEDEAQDSTILQQKLLLKLASVHKNLLRIGDINQAITSSFTDCDPGCFKKFFDENTQIVMHSSQRSCIQIQKTANHLIDFSKGNEFLKDAFFDSKLSATDNNPISSVDPQFSVFENLHDEKLFVLNKIKEIFCSGTKKSVAILLRNNYQINDWADFFSQNGLSVALRSDILEQKVIFKVIFAFLKFLQTPLSNHCVLNLMQIFNNCNIIRFSKNDYTFVQNLKIPFIQSYTDDFPSESLLNLWWNLQFNDDLSYCTPDIAAIKIGLRFFNSQNEKSNVYLISTIIKRIMNTYSSDNSVLDKLEQISKRPIGSYFKFFEDENIEKNSDVKIMTIHKSKGDEFDVVFIPETSEENFPLLKEKVKIKSYFTENIRELRFNYKKRSVDEMKKQIAQETIRLLYVGFTRAKTDLFVTCADKNKFGKKIMPSIIFNEFGDNIL